MAGAATTFSVGCCAATTPLTVATIVRAPATVAPTAPVEIPLALVVAPGCAIVLVVALLSLAVVVIRALNHPF